MMKKLKNKKAFTLAELLIVIAIIAVLVAIAIPVFNAQLDKAEKGVLTANCRSALSEATVDYLDDGKLGVATGSGTTSTITYDGVDFTATVDTATHVVTVTGTKEIGGKNVTATATTTKPEPELT